jgi:translation initiation factor 5
MSKINVNKQQIDDPNYRYKMSTVNLKYEGQGNGQRTVFLNINDIATELYRDADIIVSYLTSILGCKCIINKENQYVLYGTHSKEIIQDSIYDFIFFFVLCQKCKNPETFYLTKNKNDICLKCNACSEMSDIILNKTTTKIIKQIATKILEAERKEKERLKKEDKLKKKENKE